MNNTDTKLFLAVVGLMLLTSTTAGFSIRETYPRPRTEFFTQSDTIRIIFDQPPRFPLPNNALYVVSNLQVYTYLNVSAHGDTLELSPFWFWEVGEQLHITVTTLMESTTGEPLDSAYCFDFHIKAAGGIREALLESGELNFGQVNKTAHAIAVADFDQDLFPDLAVLYTDLLGVARNQIRDRGLPFLDRPFDWQDDEISVCDGHRTLRAADLDRDGRIDLISSDYWRNTLGIHRNLSHDYTVEFGAEQLLSLNAFRPQDFVTADLTNDGRAELIVILDGMDQLIVFQNQSTPGQLDFIRLDPLPIGAGPVNIKAADLNDDGRVDLAVCYQGWNTVDFFWNESSGEEVVLERGTPLTLVGVTGATGMVIGNLYGFWDIGPYQDRAKNTQLPDILVWNEGNVTLDEGEFILRFQNYGHRLFSPQYPLATFNRAHEIVLADLDGISSMPSRNWIISRYEYGQYDSGIYTYADNVTNRLRYQSPYLHPDNIIPVDFDLDSDIDLIVNERTPSEERIVLITNPDLCQPTVPHIEVDTLDFQEAFQPVPFNRFRTTPIDSFSVLNYEIVNNLEFTVLFRDAYLPLDLNGIFAIDDTLEDGNTPYTAEYPLRVAPHDTLKIPFRFTPTDTTNPSLPGERWHGIGIIYYDNWAGGVQALGLHLFGTGGRSVLSVNVDMLDFGDIHFDEIMTREFEVSNIGNFGLRVGYRTDRLTHFSLVDSDSLPYDTLMTPDPYPVPFTRTVQFHPFLLPHDSTVMETLWVYDRRFNDTAEQDIQSIILRAGILAEIWRCDLEAKQVLIFNNDSLLINSSSILDTVTVSYTIRETAGIPLYEPFTARLKQYVQGEYWRTVIGRDFDGFDSLGVVSEEVLIRLSTTGLNTFTLTLHHGEWNDSNVENDSTAASVFVFRNDLEASWIRFFDLEGNELETASRSDSILVGFQVREINGAYADLDCRVRLKHRVDEMFQEILFDSVFVNFPPNGSFLDSIAYRLDRSGVNAFELTLSFPGGNDSNSGNDSLREELIIPRPDLRAQLNVSPTSIHLGEEVTIIYRIDEIRGFVPHDPVWYLLTDEYNGIVTRLDADTSLPFPFETLTKELTWTSTAPGRHLFKLEVFVGEEGDADYSNNVARETVIHVFQGLHAHPQPFTPNSDGFNDLLYFSFEDDRFTSPKVDIFQIDGIIITSLTVITDNAIVWNGRDRLGRLCLPGAYLYVFEDQGKKVKSGLVYLMR